MRNEHRTLPFIYSVREWKPVAQLIGGWRLPIKIELEQLAQTYLRKVAHNKQRKPERAKLKEVSIAADALAWMLDEHGIDFNTEGNTSLKRELFDMSHAIDEICEFEAAEESKSRADPLKDQYLQYICRFWHQRLMKTVSTRTDVRTGKAYGPMIRFVVFTTRPVLAPRALTDEAARHIVRRYQKTWQTESTLNQSWFRRGKGWDRVGALKPVIMAKKAATSAQ